MRIAYLWVLLVAFACTSPKNSSPVDTLKTGPAPAQSAERSPNETIVTSDCRHDGKWALCSIERRLKQSGFVVRHLDDTTHRAGFSVKPVVYMLAKSRLEIFLYRDSASAARDVAKLDTLTVGPAGLPSQWGDSPPTLIRSANIAAVFLSLSARQTERAVNALTAGPPQAGSPR